MISLISDNKEAIADLCRKYRIRKLGPFGSAATGAFDPETRDIDFIVDLGESDHGLAQRYFDFIWELEDPLGYPVEMVTEPSIKNPYFREAIEEQRTVVYEAGNGQWESPLPSLDLNTLPSSINV